MEREVIFGVKEIEPESWSYKGARVQGSTPVGSWSFWSFHQFLGPIQGFPGGTVVKNLPANSGDAGNLGSIPGLGRSPGGGNGNPLQYSCLENPRDSGAWLATVYRVTKSQIQLSLQLGPIMFPLHQMRKIQVQTLVTSPLHLQSIQLSSDNRHGLFPPWPVPHPHTLTSYLSSTCIISCLLTWCIRYCVSNGK